ncbi:MAG: rRNA adenine dimethyltransferase family protein [Acidobacteriota bacterium]
MDVRERNRRRRYGQNDLHDRALVARILDRIAAPLPISETGWVEIGPGLGALTLPLIERSPAGYAGLELDADRARALARTIAPHGVRTGDATDPAVVAATLASIPAPRRILGSLPYNAATRIVDALLSCARDGGIADVHVIVQREVGERLAAIPRSPSYGFLTTITQLRAEAALLETIPASAFRPRPRVTSALVRLVPRREPPEAWGELRAFLAQAFRARRKTLENSLGPTVDRERLRRWLDLRHLPPRTRAEELAPETLLDLFRARIIGP